MITQTNSPKKNTPKPELSVYDDSHLEPGVWPADDFEWKDAISFIQRHVRGIMAICNKQAGPNPYESYMPYDEDVLFWYGHLADHITKMKSLKQIEARDSDCIEV